MAHYEVTAGLEYFTGALSKKKSGRMISKKSLKRAIYLHMSENCCTFAGAKV